MDNYAVVKIGYSSKTGLVRVAIDERNTGNFHICVSEHVDLKPDWWKTAHIGISASTGQLADNHDILSVETITGIGDPDLVTSDMSKENKETEKEDTEFFARLLAENNIQKESLSETEKTLLRVIEKLEVQQESDVLKLKREVEHTLVAVDDSLNNMIKKLQQSSDISESRIFDIEQTLKRDVQSSINTKLEKRVKAIEDVFDAHLKEAVKKSNKAWMIPFVLLVVVIAFVLLFVYVGMGRECEV